VHVLEFDGAICRVRYLPRRTLFFIRHTHHYNGDLVDLFFMDSISNGCDQDAISDIPSTTIISHVMSDVSSLPQSVDLDSIPTKRYRIIDPHHLTAPNMIALARDMQESCDLNEALEKYRAALDLQEMHTPDSLSVATTRFDIGRVLFDLKYLDGALHNLKVALRIRQRDAPDSLVVADTMVYIGIVLSDKGDLNESLLSHQNGLLILDKVAPSSSSAIISRKTVGLLLNRMGNFDEASRYMNEALEICQKISPMSVDVAKLFCAIGSALDERGDIDGAQKYYNKAFQIAVVHIHKLDLSITFDCAATWSDLGEIMSKAGYIDQALGCYDCALSILKMKSPKGYKEAQLRLLIGTLFERKGDYKRALHEFKYALKIQKSKNSNWSVTCPTLIGLVQLQTKFGNYSEAISLYKLALHLTCLNSPDSIPTAFALNTAALYCIKYKADLTNMKNDDDTSIPCFLNSWRNEIGNVSYGIKRAITLWDRAISGLERKYPDQSHFILVTSYSNLGSCLFFEGLVDGAMVCCKKALVAYNRVKCLVSSYSFFDHIYIYIYKLLLLRCKAHNATSLLTNKNAIKLAD
jgi:tetratricopeptide (TPR) repeat protein